MATQSSVWDEIQAHRAAASPGPDAELDHDPVFAHDAATVVPASAVEPPAAAPPPGVGIDPVSFVIPEPTGWADPLTGTEGPRFWERIIVKEEARRRRYGRDASVALVDLTGFEGNRDRSDPELAMQSFARVARALAEEVRTSDHIARIGAVRFGIVLIETDEIGAINFVDRARARCAKEFWAGSGLGLRIGWASAGEAGGLGAAVQLAERRLGDAGFQEAQLGPA